MSVIESILGPDGAIARRLGDVYESRPQQIQMAQAVQNALECDHHLIVEAGTGVGKSFAYLIPTIDYVLRFRKRVVISTHTIALQEQLIEKDIPLLRSVYPDEFTAVLVKGRGNYLCLRRMNQAISRQYMLFDSDRQMQMLQTIQDWSETTPDGSLTSLPILPDPSVWDKVNAEQGNCLGKKCSFYERCYWQAARRRMQTGQILVVNHALFFSDLALRMAGASYLPNYDAVIFDEAHTLEDVAGEHFGMHVSESSVKYQLRTLYDPRKGSGILSTHGACANSAIGCIVELQDTVNTFFDRIVQWQEQHGRSNGRVHEPNVVPNDLSPRLDDLVKYLHEMILHLHDNEQAVGEISTFAERINQLSRITEAVLSQSISDAVYWFEITKRGSARYVDLHAAPVDVAEGLRRELFEKIPRLILTSATLTTATDHSEHRFRGTRGSHGSRTRHPPADRFSFIRKRLGIDSAQTLELGSPFDYASQATLYIENNLPDPSDTLRFLPAAADKILHYLRMTHGGAFVLFTSYQMLNESADLLKKPIQEMGLELLIQGQQVNRKMLIDQFRQRDNAVLFGTSSFWQGIDVQGDKLRNVIIVKLPFSVPDEPLLEAKIETIRRTGGNPFLDLQVPEAIIRLKQGFGRLIRSKSDRGIVVILDNRIRTKRYGRLFLSSLPPAKVVDVTG